MKFQLKRLITQILIFFSANLGGLGVRTGFCYPFFYCNACPTATAGCPLRAIEKGVFQQGYKWTLILYPLLILGFFGMISGRAICGWACPIGLLQRGTGRVARKIKKIPFAKKLGSHRLEPKLRYIKYFILIGLVVVTTALIGFMFTDICPIGFLTGTIPTLILYPGEFVPNAYFIAALIIFLLFIILIFLIERGWCRYFCPLGAILAPFNMISILHIEKVDNNIFEKECIQCNACNNICPMGIYVINLKRDPECILCGKCVTICPRNLIEYRRN
jgi:polyferredoxin